MKRIGIVLAAMVLALACPAAQAQTTDSEASAGADTSAAEAPEEPDGSAVAGDVESNLSVIRAYVCKDIEQSEPAEAGKSFIADPDGLWRLCCFSEIAATSYPDTVVHAWFWGDRLMAEVRLFVGAATWRTWSTKRILDEWRGEWHVDILDRQGLLLERLDFSVE